MKKLKYEEPKLENFAEKLFSRGINCNSGSGADCATGGGVADTTCTTGNNPIGGACTSTGSSAAFCTTTGGGDV